MNNFQWNYEKVSRKEMPLDARQLNAFVTLAETGSFTETARRLSLTQSAVSHSMRALEAETHCRLLTKMGKSFVPTEAGEALFAPCSPWPERIQ